MKKRSKIVVGASIACLFIALAIQMVGGIGLNIEPYKATVKQGYTITYDITISSDDNDYFDVTVIPRSCKIGWFNWTKKQAYVAAGSQEHILLNVTPSEEGNFEFDVKAVSIMNPGTSGVFTASIEVEEGEQPDLIITEIWPVKTVVHYTLKNIGTANAPAGSETTLFVDGAFIMEDRVSIPLAPGESVKRWFKNYDWTTPCTPQHDVVIIKVCADNNKVIDELDENNNCRDWTCPPCPEQPCIALTPDKSEPQVPGTIINWTACACDPEVEGCKLCYRFWLEGPGTGGNKIIMQNWSTNNTCSLSTIWPDIGDSNIYVDAADCDHLIVLRTAVYRNYTIAVNYPPVCACLMPDKTSPQQLEEDNEENITWNASAFDPEGDTLEYRFLLSGPGTGHNFTVMQDWRNASYPECPTWTWTPGCDDMGNNHIKVEIRDGQYVPYPDYSDVNATYPKYWIGPAE